MASSISTVIENPKVRDIFQQYESNILNNKIYDSLIDRVLEHPKLTQWINNKTSNDMSIINLIDKDWQDILKNNPLFQKYINLNVAIKSYQNQNNNKNITSYHIGGYTNFINVIVVGTFKLIEKDNKLKLSILDCMPLHFIGDILSLKIDKEILHNAKFFFTECNGLCRVCRDFKRPFNSPWCIQNNMVYSNDLNYSTGEYCLSLFKGEVKAIARIQINGMYTFGSNFTKLGGTVKSMVFIEDIFNDSNNDNNNLQGILQVDENFVPTEGNNTSEQESEEMSNQPITTTDQSNTTVTKDTAVKRKSEENKPEVKFLKQDNIVLAIPDGVDYKSPVQRQFEVETTVKHIPET